MSDLSINDQIVIPGGELRFSFSRSPGPGGQNVNKVNSKATLKWDVARSTAISGPVRDRMMVQNRTRINAAGELVLTCHVHRDQKRNIDECRERLRQLLLRAAIRPKRRQATRPTAGSVRRRIAAKKRQSERKQSRRSGASSPD